MADTNREAKIAGLLEETSRTFALCIPQLPQPTRHEVGIAYLLFRIADTFEDATTWPRNSRLDALDDFCDLLQQPSPEMAEELSESWLKQPPCKHKGYLNLLSETPDVVGAFLTLSEGARTVISKHVLRTARRMASFVARADASGHVALRDFEDLRAYCYAVAGIVGEMLTRLFVRDRSELAPVESYLSKRAPLFGEGLQLTNVLKDAAVDEQHGRRFLPENVDRTRVFELAREDLNAAAEYTLALQRADAPNGIVSFNALPLRLAIATIDRVEQDGPGSKLSRTEVFDIVSDVQFALRSGRPVVDHQASAEPPSHFGSGVPAP